MTRSRKGKLQKTVIGATTMAYRHDASGQLEAENTSRSFASDHAGRLSRFTVRAGAGPASVVARYLYDASGQRVKKLVRKAGGDESTVYIDGLFEHLRSGGAEQCVLHIMDDERRIAVMKIGAPLPGDGASDKPVQYHLGDHLDSSDLVIGGASAADASLIRREEYTPYGVTSFGSYGRKRYRYTAKECDEESGLYYVGARYYAPWLARWTSCDPTGLAAYTNLFVLRRQQSHDVARRRRRRSEASTGRTGSRVPPEGQRQGRPRPTIGGLLKGRARARR